MRLKNCINVNDFCPHPNFHVFLGLVYPIDRFFIVLGCKSRKSIPHQIQPIYIKLLKELSINNDM